MTKSDNLDDTKHFHTDFEIDVEYNKVGMVMKNDILCTSII